MDIAQTPKAPLALVLGRNIVGMALVALMNPLIYADPNPVFVWLTGWVAVLAIVGLLYGLYALFFTGKAKSHRPTGFIILAWVMVVLYALGGWSEYNSIKADASKMQGQTERWKSGIPVN